MSESLIHIKLEYDESLNAKREILSSQKDLINLLKTVKRYHIIRSGELKLRLNLQKKIKELKANVTKLENLLPKVKIPSILNRELEDARKEPAAKKIKKQDYDKQIEDQLREIQEKLKRLG